MTGGADMIVVCVWVVCGTAGVEIIGGFDDVEGIIGDDNNVGLLIVPCSTL